MFITYKSVGIYLLHQKVKQLVKSADARIAKYTAKYDGTTVGARFTQTKDGAVRAVQVRFAEFAQLEATIKTLIEDKVSSPTTLPFYLSCARELLGKSHKYGGLVLWNEAQASKTKWVARGLAGTIIDSIIAAVGITVAIYGA